MAVNYISCFTITPLMMKSNKWQVLDSHLGVGNTIFFQAICSLANGKSLLSGLLLSEFDLLFVLTLDLLGLLSHMELNVAVGGKIRRDSTVGSVSSSSSFASSLGGNVSDGALCGVKHLFFGLAVSFKVLKQVQNVFTRLLGESTVMMMLVLAHGVSSGTTSVPSERNDVLLLKNALDIFDGLKKVHATTSTGSLISVLVMSTKIVDSGGSSYKITNYNAYSWMRQRVSCST